MIKVGKLPHVIKELKKNNAKDQIKAAKWGNFKKGQDAGNIDDTTMAEDSQTKNYPNFLSKVSYLFPALWGGGWDEGLIIIEAEMGGHFVHCMYVDGGSSSKIQYEHCFNRFRSEIKRHMVPAAIPLVGFSREIIFPLGQLSLLVKIGDEKDLTSAWMNFMVVSDWGNGHITEQRDYSARMHNGLRTRAQQHLIDQATEEKIQVVIHPEYPEQTIAIGFTLTEEGQKELCEHRLNIREGCLLVRQKKMSTEQEVIRDIKEMFKILREINMKLNPKKCTFRMREDMLLGYKVNADGLKVCLDKVEVVLNLPSPKCLKDVQKLNEKLTSLNSIQTNEEIDSGYQKKKEELVIYLAAAKEAISAVLMTERDGKQMPIYFVSRILQGLEVNYTPMEKLILSLKNMTFIRPRTSVKGQILTDFIMERLKDDSLDTPMKDKEELPDP
nr:hypothetical protein [Tanacetum cinerariifolium]